MNPKQAISGVIISSIGNQYALNASAARDLCEHLGLTIASKAQVAEAQKHGLETCRSKRNQIQIISALYIDTNQCIMRN